MHSVELERGIRPIAKL